MQQVFIFFLCTSLFLLTLSSCDNTGTTVRDSAKSKADSIAATQQLAHQLVGDWETISFQVNVNTANDSDSSYTMYVAAGEWEEKVGMRPFLTTYRANNTYLMAFRNLQDSIVDQKRGIWNIFSDTILLIESEASYQYHIRAKNEYLEFKTLMDWDGDGIDDDEYSRVEKRVSQE